MIKRLFCKHMSSTLIRKGQWIPSFYTTNGLEDEEERILIFQCDTCKKQIKKKQVRSYGSIIDFD